MDHKPIYFGLFHMKNKTEKDFQQNGKILEDIFQSERNISVQDQKFAREYVCAQFGISASL